MKHLRPLAIFAVISLFLFHVFGDPSPLGNVQTARDNYQKAIQAARSDYVKALTDARDAAMVQKDLKTANSIQAELDGLGAIVSDKGPLGFIGKTYSTHDKDREISFAANGTCQVGRQTVVSRWFRIDDFHFIIYSPAPENLIDFYVFAPDYKSFDCYGNGKLPDAPVWTAKVR